MAWRGLLNTSLHELRIQFSQTSAESAGIRYAPRAPLRAVVGRLSRLGSPLLPGPRAGHPRCSRAVPWRRNFVNQHYLEMKKAAPKLPILIREAEHAAPRVVARFGARAHRCGRGGRRRNPRMDRVLTASQC